MAPMHKPRNVLTLSVVAFGLTVPAVSCRAPGAIDLAAEPFPQAQQEVQRTLGDLLRAAERKDFAKLEAMHLYGPKFSKWAGSGPVRLDAEATRRTERAGIEALDAMKLTVEDLKVDVFGQVAVATFVMAHEAVARGQTTHTKVRATLVWVKVDAGWKIAHEHFSPVAASP